jgi:hypothetical protein
MLSGHNMPTGLALQRATMASSEAAPKVPRNGTYASARRVPAWYYRATNAFRGACRPQSLPEAVIQSQSPVLDEPERKMPSSPEVLT